MTVTAVFNAKGGVGKTSTTTVLATLAAQNGQRVLCIDADAQGNLTAWTGHDDPTPTLCLSHILQTPSKTRDAILAGRGDWAGIDIIPAAVSMETYARSANFGEEFDLRDQVLPNVNDYDLILIDCPPSNGFFTLSSLIAADDVIIPSRPSRFSVDGVTQAFETISYVQQRQNPRLTVKGVLILGYFTGQSTSEQIEQELRNSLGDLVFATTIPHRTAMTKAEDTRVPITNIDEPGARDLLSAFTDVYNQLNH